MTVSIVTRDTTQALGLRYLLRQYFDTDARCMNCAPSDNADTPATLYIVSAECMAEAADFFMVRRLRTCIIGTAEKMLNVWLDEAGIVEQLQSCLKRHNDDIEADQTNSLTQREIEVLGLVASGLINKEIADRLGISFNTVLTHRKNITAKLGIKSVSGLSVYAMMHGYIQS